MATPSGCLQCPCDGRSCSKSAGVTGLRSPNQLWATVPEPNSGRRCPNQTPRGADARIVLYARGADARGVAGHDVREVEVDSDGEVDSRDDLDALAVLAVEHVEEAVVLLLVLGQWCVMYETVCAA